MSIPASGEAELRLCPYNIFRGGRHKIVRNNCRFCGTSVETILREQPGVDDPQPKVATS